MSAWPLIQVAKLGIQQMVTAHPAIMAIQLVPAIEFASQLLFQMLPVPAH